MLTARSIARTQFSSMIKNMVVFDPDIKRDLYNPKRKNLAEPEYKFHGSYLCGLATYILGYYYHETYNTKIMKSSFGYGDYYEDHCYLLLDDSIIVDPTIRQFLNDDRDDGFSEYSKFIYEENDPVFVGEYSNLMEYLYTLKSLNKKHFGTSSIRVSELKDYWEGKEDVTHKLEDLISYTSGECVPTDDFNKRLLMEMS